MHYTCIISKHYQTTYGRCDHEVLYQKVVLPPVLHPIAVFLNSWLTFEQTALTDICINVLLQCNSDLTKQLPYSSYLKRQINPSAVFGFLLLFDAHLFNFSDFFPLFLITFYEYLYLIYMPMLSCVVQITIITIQ